MGAWSSSAAFDGDPQRLLRVLTEIDSIERWSPVPFRLADGADRLRAGQRLVVEGVVLGRSVSFDVEVDQADERGLSLRASGAFEIDVDYRIDRAAGTVSASVGTRGRGALARVLASAANAMLSAGALERVLRRVINESNPPAACLAA
jgi:hypothetical protein